mmetsp:Transcript_68978/g.213303  ORF Transcript_68978/g.213303 Transcript_68978/m.213303 type:complete len:305 (+) Transcript_68978:164-1078(+)
MPTSQPPCSLATRPPHLHGPVPCGCSREGRHEVQRLPGLRPDGEVQRHPVAGHRVRHVDLDATNEHQVAFAEVRVDDLEDLLLDDFVGLHGQLHHLIAGPRDFIAVRLQLRAQPALLHVAGIEGHRLAGGDLAEGRNCGATGGRGGGLPRAQELPRLAAGREADVRAEDQHNMASVGHVCGEGPEAGLAHVRRPTDSPEEEARAVVPREDGGDVPRVTIDLVRADGLAVDDVVTPHAESVERLQDPGGHLGAGHCAGEARLHLSGHAPLHRPKEGRVCRQGGCAGGRLGQASDGCAPQPRGAPQ